jgi:hypothetical protein
MAAVRKTAPRSRSSEKIPQLVDVRGRGIHSGKQSRTKPLTFFVPCWLCGDPLRLLYSEKGKPYLSCGRCGMQCFIRGRGGLAILAGKAKGKNQITAAAFFGDREKFALWCQRFNRKKKPSVKPTCCQCGKPLMYQGRGRPPNHCGALGLSCRPSLLR